jgi:hypothetical protein
MHSAVNEVISICYMLQCLGVPVTKPTVLFGDNFAAIKIPDLAAAVLMTWRT